MIINVMMVDHWALLDQLSKFTTCSYKHTAIIYACICNKKQNMIWKQDVMINHTHIVVTISTLIALPEGCDQRFCINMGFILSLIHI